MGLKKLAKYFIKKLPPVKRHLDIQRQEKEKLNNKNESLSEKNNFLSEKNHTLSLENMELRRQIKILKNQKISIVFVCHRPAIWNYLKSIFEACNADDSFDVTILAIPNKKQLPDKGFNHEVYETEGAEEFFENFPCKVINGYDYELNKWIDLESLKPDYVFFQTPYNVCRAPVYNSKLVSAHTRICYFHYGFPMLREHSVIKEFAESFIQFSHLIFAETEFHKQHYITEILKHNKSFDISRIHLVGQTAFDDVEQYQNSESNLWKHSGHKKFRILRTPRWTTDENNCTFTEYKDFLFDYAEQNDCDYIFRPHPQALLNYVIEGIMSEKDVSDMKLKYENSKNCTLDLQKAYLETLYSADVLVSDPSGIDFEYFITGKPLVYTEKSNDWANDWAKKIIVEGSYRAKNKEELKNILDMLRAGNDPMYEQRQKIIKENFFFPKEKKVGVAIKEIIKQDFFNQ